MKKTIILILCLLSTSFAYGASSKAKSCKKGYKTISCQKFKTKSTKKSFCWKGKASQRKIRKICTMPVKKTVKVIKETKTKTVKVATNTKTKTVKLPKK